ncbi:PH domain-containing protein [Tenacibaculum amylolyticum]|uniref:PH domain-containing protein n=1 Tax=Tenacibaculum amylolyticum TaxID=104269 RepID=UPI003895929F
MQEFQNKEIKNYPDIAEVTFEKVEKNYLKVILMSTISYFIGGFLFFMLLIEYLLKKRLPEDKTLFYILFGIIFIVAIILLIAGFAKRKYVVRDKDISYKSGLLTQTMVTVPFSRIQHIEITEGVFSRIFKLATISVFTAGDSSDDLEVGGISREKALQIKEFITQKINE